MEHDEKAGPKLARTVSFAGGVSFFAGIVFLNLALEYGSENRIKATMAVTTSLLFMLVGLLVVLSSRLRNLGFLSVCRKPRVRTVVTFSLLLSIFVANYVAVGMRSDAYPFYSVQMFQLPT